MFVVGATHTVLAWIRDSTLAAAAAQGTVPFSVITLSQQAGTAHLYGLGSVATRQRSLCVIVRIYSIIFIFQRYILVHDARAEEQRMGNCGALGRSSAYNDTHVVACKRTVRIICMEEQCV